MADWCELSQLHCAVLAVLTIITTIPTTACTTATWPVAMSSLTIAKAMADQVGDAQTSFSVNMVRYLEKAQLCLKQRSSPA